MTKEAKGDENKGHIKEASNVRWKVNQVKWRRQAMRSKLAR